MTRGRWRFRLWGLAEKWAHRRKCPVPCTEPTPDKVHVCHGSDKGTREQARHAVEQCPGRIGPVARWLCDGYEYWVTGGESPNSRSLILRRKPKDDD